MGQAYQPHQRKATISPLLVNYSRLQEICASLGIRLNVDAETFRLLGKQDEKKMHEIIDWCFRKKASLSAGLVKGWECSLFT